MASRAEDKHPHSSLPSSSTEKKLSSLLPINKLIVPLFLFFVLSLLLFLYVSPQFQPPQPDASSHSLQAACDADIASFYIYDLPDRFDRDLIRSCRSLSPTKNMCPHVANRGLGQPIPHRPDWFATNPYVAAMLFRARAERHPCRTFDPGSAALFYIPFYAGLYTTSVSSQRNHTLRDALGIDLADYVSRFPTFRRHGGRDHFLITGRTSWELMRSVSRASENSTANCLLRLPELANVSILTIERSVQEGKNQFAIPHPSYFHPRSADELTAWQEEVRRTERTHLFAFVGGARTGGQKEVMRALVLEQCGSSSRCLLLDCKGGSKDCRTPGSLLGCKRGSKDCRTPGRVMDVLMRAEFCLQPQGDTFTRRSVFDSVLAGCVPVFFSEHTAYTQYPWYLPGRAEEWSVFLGPERRGRIEEELSRIPKDAVARMREVVIGMIPRFTFAHPNASWAEGRRFRDTVDVALAALTKRVRDALSESENNSTRPK
ncbi:Xyloglucan galactosyltransferase KATAMARI [Ananas comosus]|uniref:Xyloglucan galactosyltransferase KATAMARI n=1 Tax=Ananas comosus TaxID=4615 RepID=A0A199UF73_ANACO|nr:Xyloglucan galactosyltransferase KATAMARI [Ananas comosus]